MYSWTIFAFALFFVTSPAVSRRRGTIQGSNTTTILTTTATTTETQWVRIARSAGQDCDFASKTFERHVNKDSFSPSDTKLTESIVTLLQYFAKWQYTVRDPRNICDIDKLSRILKLEFVTYCTRHHFILPANAHKRDNMFDLVMHFILRWFDPATAQEAESAFEEDTRKVAGDASAKLTAEEYHKLIDQVGDLLGKRFDYQQTADLGVRRPPIVSTKMETFQIKAYFSFDDLNWYLEKRKNETVKSVVDWLNNFVVRRFLAHEQIVQLTKVKVRQYTESKNESLKVFKDHLRARAIFSAAKQQSKIKCAYVKMLDEYATNFEARNWTSEPMDMDVYVRPKLIKALQKEGRSCVGDLEKEFDKILEEEVNIWSEKVCQEPKHQQFCEFFFYARKTWKF